MRNVAGRGVLSIMLMLLVGFAYAQQQVEDETVVAKDSQETIRKTDKKTETETKDNKAVVNIDERTEVKGALGEVKTEESNTEEAAEPAPAAESKSSARAFRATAYCLKGKTASGKRVRRGIIAADPRVLPLGTMVRLTGGKYSGEYVVADTGGRIKGRKIDIWMPSCREARTWGNRSVKVTVMSKPTKRRR